MTDVRTPTNPSTHAAHDATLIAALAARAPDLTDADRVKAQDLLTTCADCTRLLTDLVALQVALPTTSTPARPRDFSLTPADAARLRARGWRRLFGFLGSSRDSISRPLAMGLTTLGIAGLLVAAVPSMFGAGGASVMLSPVGGQVENAAPSGAPAAAGAYGTDRVATPAEAGASEDGGVFSGGEPQQLEATRDIAGDAGLLSIRDDATGLSVLLVVAGILLIAGLGLFGLRWSARRLL